MGIVFDARDPRLDRRVAIKTLKPGTMSREEALERFRREAEVSANLRNPHVVTIYDFGTDSEAGPYLVMERLSGRSLADAVNEEGALDADLVVAMVAEIASALEAAHRTGVVHRDVKVENILLSDDGGCRLTDFGIARREDSSLTTTSAIPGTPSILAPEVLDGKRPTAASDQFSLAVVAATALSGRPPFNGETITQVLYRITLSPPELSPSLPRGLRRVLERGLAKNPEDRFPSVTAFAEALEGASRGLFEPAAAWSQTKRWPLQAVFARVVGSPWGSAVVAASVVVAIALAFAATRIPSKGNQAQVPVAERSSAEETRGAAPAEEPPPEAPKAPAETRQEHATATDAVKDPRSSDRRSAASAPRERRSLPANAKRVKEELKGFGKSVGKLFLDLRP